MMNVQEATRQYKDRIGDLINELSCKIDENDSGVGAVIDAAIEKSIARYCNWATVSYSFVQTVEMLGIDIPENASEGYQFELCSAVLGLIVNKLEGAGFSVDDNEASSDGWRIDFEWPSA